MISIAKFAKSKFFVPGFVIALVVIGWLVLIWTQISPSEEPEETTATTWSQKGDYAIKETPEGTFVVNEKAGLTFKVPEGWNVEVDELPGRAAGVNFLEKTTKLDPQYGIFVGGCAIELAINSNEVLTKDTQEIISYLEQHPEESDVFIKVIGLDHHKALKKIGQADSKFGKSINVEIPLGEKLCYITTRPLLKEEERCSQEFDKFLETVSIR